MVIYIMRHAEAVEGSDTLHDEWRYLTEKGRKTAECIGTAIVEYGRKPRLTLTSPLTRAVQTAEIVAVQACRKNKVIVSEDLVPGGDINKLISFVRTCKDAKRILLVGHEPQLSELVTTMLGCTDIEVSLKKGACVALELDPDAQENAQFLWYMAPGKKRVTAFKKAFINNKVV